MKTHGSVAMTTVIIIRFRSIASRTCDPVVVTDGGEYKNVSIASHSGCQRCSRPPFSKVGAMRSSRSRSQRISFSFSMRSSAARSSGP